MKIQLLRTAFDDIALAQEFYEQLQSGLGVYFQDAIFSNIDALIYMQVFMCKFLGFTVRFQKLSPMQFITNLIPKQL